MIGSNLYVGDFGDYQADELLEFQSNFNLQLWFFTTWKILKHFFSFNRDQLWGANPGWWTDICHHVVLALFLIAISLDRR